MVDKELWLGRGADLRLGSGWRVLAVTHDCYQQMTIQCNVDTAHKYAAANSSSCFGEEISFPPLPVAPVPSHSKLFQRYIPLTCEI
jgi:hypothetical protein